MVDELNNRSEMCKEVFRRRIINAHADYLQQYKMDSGVVEIRFSYRQGYPSEAGSLDFQVQAILGILDSFIDLSSR